MQVQVAEWTADGRTGDGERENDDEADDVAELREARTEDVDGVCGAERGSRAEAFLEQRNADEAEQREVELCEEDGDAHPRTCQNV